MSNEREVKGCKVFINEDTVEICGKYGYRSYDDYKDKSISLDDFINDRVDALLEMIDYMESDKSSCSEIKKKGLEFWKNLRSVDVWADMVLFTIGPEANSKRKSIRDRLWAAYTTYMNLLLDNYPEIQHFRENFFKIISEDIKCKTRNNIPIG